MYILLLQLIIFNLCAVTLQSSSQNDKVDELNKILSGRSWKWATGLVVDQFGKKNETVQYLLKPVDGSNYIVNEKNLTEKLTDSSRVLNSIYLYVMQHTLFGHFVTRVKNIFDNDISKIRGCEGVLEVEREIQIETIETFTGNVGRFDPLITCMIKALEFFNENSVLLETLKNLKKWHSNIEADERTLNSETAQEYYQNLKSDVFNEAYDSLDTFEMDKDDTFVTIFIKSSTVPHMYTEEVRCVDPDKPYLDSVIKMGVQHFCCNFGFRTDISMTTIMNQLTLSLASLN